jgi:hypothetical protein
VEEGLWATSDVGDERSESRERLVLLCVCVYGVCMCWVCVCVCVYVKDFEQKVDFEIQDSSNWFSKNTFQISDGFVFCVDPASHYHGAAGREKEIRKTAGKQYFWRTNSNCPESQSFLKVLHVVCSSVFLSCLRWRRLTFATPNPDADAPMIATCVRCGVSVSVSSSSSSSWSPFVSSLVSP